MRNIPLKVSKTEKSALRRASRSRVELDFAQLSRYFRQGKWLPNSHRYRDNCVDRIEEDCKAHTLQTKPLCSYIAASALPHALNGWSFLGRALAAHLRGDSVSCRHLAYYAELRAAMSLLATQGVGIFSHQNFTVQKAGHASLIPSRATTHKIAWKALSHWASLKRSSALLGEIITPGGLPIRDWQTGIFSDTGFRAVGTRWLRRWGLDIQRCANDQKLRNLSSYRPSRFKPEPCPTVESRVEFVREFWRLCEPSGAELFQRLDRHLLRMWVREQYEAVRGSTADQTNSDYRREVTNLVTQTNPQGLSADLWIEFLIDRGRYADSAVLSFASRDEEPEHLSMLARAALLLRLASGASRSLLFNSGLDKTQLQFWWRTVGQELMLWDASAVPSDVQSLWDDIEAALGDLEEWLASPDPEAGRTFRIQQASALAIIDETERAALWGMGL